MGYVSVCREGILFPVEAHGFLLLKMGVIQDCVSNTDYCCVSTEAECPEALAVA